MSKQQMNSTDAAWFHLGVSTFSIIDALAHELRILARLRPRSTSKRERQPGVESR
jgi:hypothetical protein